MAEVADDRGDADSPTTRPSKSLIGDFFFGSDTVGELTRSMTMNTEHIPRVAAVARKMARSKQKAKINL